MGILIIENRFHSYPPKWRVQTFLVSGKTNNQKGRKWMLEILCVLTIIGSYNNVSTNLPYADFT